MLEPFHEPTLVKELVPYILIMYSAMELKILYLTVRIFHTTTVDITKMLVSYVKKLNVMKMMYVLLMETVSLMEEWKSASMEHGGLFVITFGIVMMLWWYVDNWIFLRKVYGAVI